MDSRTPSTSARGVASPRSAMGSPLRPALLASTALALAMMLPATGPARAQDAAWSASPATGNFNAGMNWSGSAVPTGTAYFGTSNTSNLSFSNNATLGGWTFNAGASNYIFNNNWALTFNGAGIVMNGGSATIANNGDLLFYNASSAGGATVSNTGWTEFHNTSSAGRATLSNDGYLLFYDGSTAGNAIVTNNVSGVLTFSNTSTAGSAVITNNGSQYFYDNSSAGSATIVNNSNLYLMDSSTAGGASITNSSGALTQFSGYSTAGTADIANRGELKFIGGSSAGNATIANANVLGFYASSTAGSATITNNGNVTFFEASTAGNAAIVNDYDLLFYGGSTAGSATIINNSVLSFSGTSSAGNATITNNSSLYFYNSSTAGNAALINNGGGTVDFTFTAGLNNDSKVSVGSIAGAGNYILGSNQLTVGSNNLSTEVSGVISGSGSLIKVGTGILTLSGVSTYTSGTTINGGALQLGSTDGAGSILGTVTIGSSGAFDVVNADTSGITSITNDGLLNFRNTSTAGSATVTNNYFMYVWDNATAGSATITNNNFLFFRNTSTAGTATITNAHWGDLYFYDTSTAGNATITNDRTVEYYDLSSAGNATISNNASLGFNNSSRAGSATITNNSGGRLNFFDTSTAGNATINNSNILRFYDTSTAGSASILNSGTLNFYNTSTAGSATITNDVSMSFRDASSADRAIITNSGPMLFGDTSTAGNATINNYGRLNFQDVSTAGNATITNDSQTLNFRGASTAGNATISNNGTLDFFETSTAGSANITNDAFLDFINASTAGNATIANNNSMSFNSSSTAGNATITNYSFTVFQSDSTAANATIINNGILFFSENSTADSATITNNNNLFFFGNSTAGNAALINNAGHTVDFSSSTGPNGDGRLSAGSIAGAGNYILGANELTVGSNDLSTEVSGTISGSGGSLVKTGTGTLTLSGATTYTGVTTISAGALQFGNGISGGIANLAGSINVAGGTLAIQAPRTLNVAQTVAFSDGTTLSIAAGASSPALSADSITIGNGVTFNISGITNASQLDMVLIDTASGISGDFAGISVGGFSGTVDYLTASTRKSADGLQYLASYGLAWTAGNNLAHGTFTLTNATDSFTVGAALADQAANPATGWNGTSLTKAGAGTLILTGTNTYTGGTTISGGTLSVSRDANLGAATGGLTFTGGALSTTASFDTARPVSLTQAGRFDVAAETELGLTGVVSGGGDLIKQGSGIMRLDNGANAYGNTLVAAGTLIGNAASISGNIGNAGTVIFNQAGNASFAGDIAALNGTGGAMIKRGAGVLTLNGRSSLDWTVEAGGLVSSAEHFGGNAAIAAGASFTFDQAVGATYAGVISGSGRFTKAGAGFLTLTGNSSAFSGTTTIENGTLAVNGSLGGIVQVLAGGRLQGSGTVSNMSVSGTIAPGNSIGTLNIAGNVTFATGSIYEVEVNAAGQSDKIVASGTATISGSSVKVLAGIGNYAPQTRYTILTANGGRSGTFSGVTSNLAFLDPSLGYDDTNVYLTMTRNSIGFTGVGLTANQVATGSGVESLGQGNAVYGAVLNLSAPQARYAFDQLSGEIHASARTALVEDSRFIRNAVNDRLHAAFDGVGASGTVTTYVDGKPVTVKANTDRFAVWGQGFGSWGHANGDGNAARLNRSTGGFLIGADAPTFESWRFGAVAGYSRTSFDVKDRHSSGSSDNYHIGLYGGTAWGDVAFRTGATYTWHDISTSRNVSFPGFGNSLKGDYNAATAQVFGELAYRFNAGSARFEPFANLAFVSLHTDSFTERGGAAALHGASADTDTAFTTLGVRASTTVDLGRANLTAKGMVGWRHAFGDALPLAAMGFSGGGGAFPIGGVPIGRNAAVLEAGLDYAITPNATLGVAYNGQFGSGLADQSLRANFNVKF